MTADLETDKLTATTQQLAGKYLTFVLGGESPAKAKGAVKTLLDIDEVVAADSLFQLQTAGQLSVTAAP